MIDIAHIHPMLVHFPIVLYLLSVLLQLLALRRHGELNGHSCLSSAAYISLLLAAGSALVAAMFGDMALDHAVELGFPNGPLEQHAALGITATTLMTLLAVLNISIRLFHWKLGSTQAWIVWYVSLAGVALLIVTAYHGGELVYHLGVNVDAVTPTH